MAVPPPAGPGQIPTQTTAVQQAGPQPHPHPHPHPRVYWTSVTPDPSPPPASRRQRPFHTKFHLFPLLPIELRLRIWHFIAAGRIIELRSWGDTTLNPYTPIKFSIAPHRPPLILHINQESRFEGLRLYTAVKIGVSATLIRPGRRYIDWRYHPNNPNAVVLTTSRHGGYAVGDVDAPLSWPCKPKLVHICWARDTLYLGPEFRVQHLETFLTSAGPGFELAGLKYLALDRKLWAGLERGSWEYLRQSLYSLKKRPLKELYMVPDDERNCLQDMWYYREHEIELNEPSWRYEFQPKGERTVLVNLGGWFERLWGEGKDGGKGRRSVPKVEIKSMRRGGRRMGDFKKGIEEVQEGMGDMRVWKTWVPEQE